jgi:hypothetical protein
MEHEAPFGNFLHFVLFVAGAGIIGTVALAVIERLAGGESARIRAKHIAIVVGVFLLTVGAELVYHRLGGS